MAKINVVKVTLSTQKVVLLRVMKISDTENAAQQVAKRADGDSSLMQVMMQKALLQSLLVSIDGKALNALEREDLDSILSMGEYTQLLKVVGKLAGGDDAGKEPQIELVSGG
jgi:hypothetical protein